MVRKGTKGKSGLAGHNLARGGLRLLAVLPGGRDGGGGTDRAGGLSPWGERNFTGPNGLY
jgi:hypothetical protein